MHLVDNVILRNYKKTHDLRMENLYLFKVFALDSIQNIISALRTNKEQVNNRRRQVGPVFQSQTRTRTGGLRQEPCAVVSPIGRTHKCVHDVYF